MVPTGLFPSALYAPLAHSVFDSLIVPTPEQRTVLFLLSLFSFKEGHDSPRSGSFFLFFSTSGIPLPTLIKLF